MLFYCWWRGILVFLLLSNTTVVHAKDAVTVYAAASLANALSEIVQAYEKDHDGKIKSSFASSSTLAKHIESGAHADIFISADKRWMDYLIARDKIDTASRRDVLGNSLVVIAPKDKSFNVKMDKSFDFPAAFSGMLCTGETESVPVGIYAKQSLQALGWWQGLEKRIVGTDDVRTALAFVERAECRAGIIYATDAKVSNKVTTIANFPASTHIPIVYPFALVIGANPSAKPFFDYLTGDTAKAVFVKYGFQTLTQ